MSERLRGENVGYIATRICLSLIVYSRDSEIGKGLREEQVICLQLLQHGYLSPKNKLTVNSPQYKHGGAIEFDISNIAIAEIKSCRFNGLRSANPLFDFEHDTSYSYCNRSA